MFFSLVVVAAITVAGIAVSRLGMGPADSKLTALPLSAEVEPKPAPAAPDPVGIPSSLRNPQRPTFRQEPADPQPPGAVLDKVEKLAQIRETFRFLARGDTQTALQAARRLTDETEREAALVELVTAWKVGDLSPPRQRAQAITQLGLEAGLGLELTRNPELAVLWANELTEGRGRTAMLERTGYMLIQTDPAAALALGDQIVPERRREFVDSLYAVWSRQDTDAALKWVDTISDPEEAAAALKAIRTSAPVGIGTEMQLQDGFAVVRGLVPGAAAELSGQLHAGDRIMAVAQGDNSFVDARGLALTDVVQLIRGAPGSVVQIQVLPPDAGPDTIPRTISIVRGQIKFKPM
jgi:hypothetical protein